MALHTGEGSNLAAILQRRCRLPVSFAEDDDTIREGCVYVAPPGSHVVVNAQRRLSVLYKGRRRFARPSADWLFDTLAASYADASIGIVLSGFQHDGARGIVRIRQAGGSTIAQHPDSCDAPAMPTAAIRTGCVTWILPPSQIAGAIVDRVRSLDVVRRAIEFDNPFATSA